MSGPAAQAAEYENKPPKCAPGQQHARKSTRVALGLAIKSQTGNTGAQSDQQTAEKTAVEKVFVVGMRHPNPVCIEHPQEHEAGQHLRRQREIARRPPIQTTRNQTENAGDGDSAQGVQGVDVRTAAQVDFRPRAGQQPQRREAQKNGGQQKPVRSG